MNKQPRANRDALTVDRLAAANEFKTLAALATTADSATSSAATRALLSKADRQAAFEWLLEIATTEVHWAAMDAFPDRANLPDNLTRRMKVLVEEAAANPQLMQSTALSGLLPIIHPVKTRLALARAVMSAGSVESPIREAARAALQASSERADRAVLFADAGISPTLPERLVRLDALGEPTTSSERTALKEALDLARVAGLPGTDVAVIGRIVSRVDERWVRRWFHETWPPNARATLGADAFGDSLGREGLLSLLTVDSTDEVIHIVAAAAAGLPWPDDAAVVSKAFQLASDQPAAALARFLRPGDKPGVQPSVWPVAMEITGQPLLAQMASALVVGDLTAGAATCVGDARAPKLFAEFVGGVANKGIVGTDNTITPPDGWADEVAALNSIFGGGFLAQVPMHLPPSVAIPMSVLDLVYLQPQALAELHGCGFADQVTAGADTPDKAIAILSEDTFTLDATAVDGLLTTIGWEEPDLWERALEVVAVKNGDLVYARVADMVETLRGPEARHVPLPVLARSVLTAVKSGMKRLPCDRTPAAIATLVGSEDDALLAAACAWASTLDIGADDHELVNTVIGVDEMRSIRHDDLAALRVKVAAQLLDHAADQGRDAPERVKHLQLAAAADPQAARASAFHLAGSGVPDVRLAAAEVLATVPGALDDEGRIRDLLKSAKTVPLTEKLTEALNRLKSPGMAEAIDGLVGLLGIDRPASKLQAAHLVREREDHDRFIAAVDEVRATSSASGNVKPFANAAVVLADLLVDFALVACGDTGAGVKPQELKAIRENAANRPDAGELVYRQQLLQLFDWFPQVATLRKKRTAHPSPAGSRAPVTIADGDHAYAQNLLADIVTGWIDSMSKYPVPIP